LNNSIQKQISLKQKDEDVFANKPFAQLKCSPSKNKPLRAENSEVLKLVMILRAV